MPITCSSRQRNGYTSRLSQLTSQRCFTDDVTCCGACSMPQSRGSGRRATLHICRTPNLGRTPRAFFSGDSFLYTSKEKSYPLAVGQQKLWLRESYPLAVGQRKLWLRKSYPLAVGQRKLWLSHAKERTGFRPAP